MHVQHVMCIQTWRAHNSAKICGIVGHWHSWLRLWTCTVLIEFEILMKYHMRSDPEWNIALYCDSDMVLQECCSCHCQYYYFVPHKLSIHDISSESFHQKHKTLFTYFLCNLVKCVSSLFICMCLLWIQLVGCPKLYTTLSYPRELKNFDGSVLSSFMWMY